MWAARHLSGVGAGADAAPAPEESVRKPGSASLDLRPNDHDTSWPGACGRDPWQNGAEHVKHNNALHSSPVRRRMTAVLVTMLAGAGVIAFASRLRR